MLPECQRCLSLDLRCPGPRTGVLFVHTVPDRRQQLTTKTKQHISTSQDSAVAICRDRQACAHDSLATHLSKLPGPQPSRGGAFDQLFVTHFIESFGVVKPASGLRVPTISWVDDLPSFFTSALPPAVKHSIRAASMISYGTLSRDANIQNQAHHWYMTALRDLQRFLSRDGVSVTEGMICAAVMLIHFETWAGTRPKAWLFHVKGAAKMIEAMGPASCREGFMHRLFSHMRLQVFIQSLSENSLHAFASHEWMTKPYEIHPGMLFDHVVDLCFYVQRCLVAAQRLVASPGPERNRDLEMMLRMLIQDAESQSRFWASTYMPGMLAPAGEHGTGEKRDNGTLELVPGKVFRNFPTAVLLSLYNAANLMNIRLLALVGDDDGSPRSHPQLMPSVGSPKYVERMRQHAQSILSAMEFINAKPSGPGPNRGTIMMSLQLKVLSLWSPFLDQRSAAAALLHGEKVQSGGFASMAAETEDYFADLARSILRDFPLE
ncbi:Uncharacterized protein ESCO_003349 [Escovopsis weberi]|uniref:Uncharacterized protein n=1 Tax=Escovopsis weberi TaxID=150374 RepID=A0A0M8N8F6_ESCWE|nr:Uncharacterized protein ESCO_003349 [Escovopsis weberi]